MSKKIEDIIAVIKKTAANTSNKVNVPEARKRACNELATERNVDPTTITNSFRRNLHPHIQGTPHFDRILEEYLNNGNLELVNILKIHCNNDDDLEIVRSFFSKEVGSTLTQDISELADIQSTDAIAKIKCRLGQGKFREALIKFWKSCPLSSCDLTAVLKASHIKPWAVCDDQERLDPFNGLLLSANYDSLFDQGFISFDDSGEIIFSTYLDESNKKNLGLDQSMTITVNKKHQPYLDYHRKNVFRGENIMQ